MDPVQILGMGCHGYRCCEYVSRLVILDCTTDLTNTIVEAVGYIARCVSTQDVTKKPVYVLQFALIILAPVLMAACCYVIFSRILFLVVPREMRTFKLCWVPPRFLTLIFVGFDIVALILQLVGALMISSVDPGDTSGQDKLDRGKTIATIGVIIQLVAFGFFAIAAVRFNFTSKKFKKSLEERFEVVGEKQYAIDGMVKHKHWPALLRVVNFSTIMILVRALSELCFNSTSLMCLIDSFNLPSGRIHGGKHRVHQ